MLIFLISWSISKIGNDVKPKDKFNGIHYFIFVSHVRSMLYVSSFSNYKFYTNYIIERVEYEHLISLEIKVKFIPHIAKHSIHSIFTNIMYHKYEAFYAKTKLNMYNLFSWQTHTRTYSWRVISNIDVQCIGKLLWATEISRDKSSK